MELATDPVEPVREQVRLLRRAGVDTTGLAAAIATMLDVYDARARAASIREDELTSEVACAQEALEEVTDALADWARELLSKGEMWERVTPYLPTMVRP